MLKRLSDKLEANRFTTGDYASSSDDGGNGVFQLIGPCGASLRIVASGAVDQWTEGWEHVSVSCANRCPNWIEMSYVKDLFWGPEECVVQFHPPRSEYVNHHPYCLHLWKPPYPVITPPTILIGPRS